MEGYMDGLTIKTIKFRINKTPIQRMEPTNSILTIKMKLVAITVVATNAEAINLYGLLFSTH